tara:strand:+ start:1775 stop:2278 length:504 start_codon:yes stop_codon:yes gene_type:complete
MADRVRYAVNMTPIKETTFDIDYATASGLTDVSGVAYNFVNTAVGATLGGSDEVTATQETLNGYASGNASYLTGNAATIVTPDNCKFLFIKHTGKNYVSASAIGVENITNELTITTGSVLIASLGSGGAIILPKPAASATFTLGNTVTTIDSVSYYCAVEYVSIGQS